MSFVKMSRHSPCILSDTPGKLERRNAVHSQLRDLYKATRGGYNQEIVELLYSKDLDVSASEVVDDILDKNWNPKEKKILLFMLSDSEMHDYVFGEYRRKDNAIFDSDNDILYEILGNIVFDRRVPNDIKISAFEGMITAWDNITEYEELLAFQDHLVPYLIGRARIVGFSEEIKVVELIGRMGGKFEDFDSREFFLRTLFGTFNLGLLNGHFMSEEVFLDMISKMRDTECPNARHLLNAIAFEYLSELSESDIDPNRKFRTALFVARNVDVSRAINVRVALGAAMEGVYYDTEKGLYIDSYRKVIEEIIEKEPNLELRFKLYLDFVRELNMYVESEELKAYYRDELEDVVGQLWDEIIRKNEEREIERLYRELLIPNYNKNLLPVFFFSTPRFDIGKLKKIFEENVDRGDPNNYSKDALSRISSGVYYAKPVTI